MIRITTLLLLLSCLPPVHSADEERLSLTFDNAPVERILQALADYQQINLMITKLINYITEKVKSFHFLMFKKKHRNLQRLRIVAWRIHPVT